MNLLIITFAPLHSNAGHLARLNFELESLKEGNNISILCLNNKTGNDEDIKNYPDIDFYTHGIDFEGWKVLNTKEIIAKIEDLYLQNSIDLIILQMEVWDLIREIHFNFSKKVAVANVIHAMPFLGTPQHPTEDFEKDVKKHLLSELPEYRKNYIQEHYEEAYDIINTSNIIAANKTISYYIKNYFPDSIVYTQADSVILPTKREIKCNNHNSFDFVYMARMEKGKGLEYLDTILLKLSKKLTSKRIRVAIMGRADDDFSKNKLDQLLNLNINNLEIKFLGWADTNTKNEVLKCSKVFLYPSYYDTSPVVLLEALSQKVPAIVWSTVYSQTMYPNHKLVFKIEFDNIEEFVNKALYAWENVQKIKSNAIVPSIADYNLMIREDIEIFRKIKNRYDKNK